MYLQQKSPTELNALERRLLELIKKQSIDYFPLNKALSLPQSEQDEEVTDKVSCEISANDKDLKDAVCMMFLFLIC